MGEVSWIYELDVREGQLEALKRPMERMVATTRADEPDERLRRALEGERTSFMRPIGGFMR